MRKPHCPELLKRLRPAALPLAQPVRPALLLTHVLSTRALTGRKDFRDAPSLFKSRLIR